MKSAFILRAASAALLLGPVAALTSGAVVVQTLGSGSAVTGAPQFSANFTANISLADTYLEGGLTFSHTGLAGDSNNGCGYAGEFCEANPGDGFSLAFNGNYFAAGGPNAYVSISSGAVKLQAIEFAADSGYNQVFLRWETWLNAAQTGSGQVSLGAGGVGGVVGLADAGGFDEVRLRAFDSVTDTTGVSSIAIDSVVAAVPEPGTWALGLCGLGLVAAAVRRRRSGA